jgi:Concanavalin A-like lectin/glucanases superfamily
MDSSFTKRTAVHKAIRVAAASLVAGSLAAWNGVSTAGASASYPSIIEQDSPFAYWQLAEPHGSATATDSSGHGNAGTYASIGYSGSPCGGLGQAGPIRDYAATAALLGEQPGCYMTSTPSSYSGSYTVEAWIRPSTTTKYYQTFFDSRAADSVQVRCTFGVCRRYILSGEYSVDFKLTGTGSGTQAGQQQLYADIGDGREWLANLRTSFAFSANQWYYVALTVSVNGSNTAGVATLFVNGQPVHDVALANTGLPPLLADTQHPIVLGGNPRYDNTTTPDPENFDGTIGQVAVYEYALSYSQVAAHYSAGQAP